MTCFEYCKFYSANGKNFSAMNQLFVPSITCGNLGNRGQLSTISCCYQSQSHDASAAVVHSLGAFTVLAHGRIAHTVHYL